MLLQQRSAAHLSWQFGKKTGVVLICLGLWELLARTEVVDQSIIPALSQVAVTMGQVLGNGTLIGHTLISLQRAGIAFGLAVVCAIPLGLFMGWFRTFEEILDPLLQLCRQTSALALYPVFILLLGIGETSKISVIFWAAQFPILLNTISGVKTVDYRLIEMARVFGASHTETFTRVILPAAIPSIFVGLRLSATYSILLLVAAEMIGAKHGLGFLILNAQYNFEIPLMFAAIILLALLGLTTNYALLALQRRLCRWEAA